ncbi:hypothetical protein [Aeoliella sp.]|uniref:hypothetical protein n=1 Tax=Aeoliella sp. TaxID=2795800 RepID=UPI003CCBA821
MLLIRLDMIATAIFPRAAIPAIMLGVLFTAGCGDQRPHRVPVSGVVLVDGQPLAGAFIQFIPAEGRTAGGNTDEQGRFTLTCYELNDGATLGLHRVAVRAIDSLPNERIRWRAPKAYLDPASSGLEVEIVEPRDDVRIELTWNGGKPFVERDPLAMSP